jgi:hypothetical protein
MQIVGGQKGSNKMGRHYVPRFYLKGFTESEDSPYIWGKRSGG